jgi:hypothetical protein
LKNIVVFILASLIFIGVLLMTSISYEYISFDQTPAFLQTKYYLLGSKPWTISFYLHVFSSVFVLFFGLFQFIPFIVEHHPRFHRMCGLLYSSILLLISAPSGLVLAYHANGGIAAKTSFLTLTILWFVFTAMGLYYAMNRKFEVHAQYQLRSYALTLSALSLRFYAMIISIIGVDALPSDKYILIAWLSWVPNLLIAEWLIKGDVISKVFFRKNLVNTIN